jgi:hypothetical protein
VPRGNAGALAGAVAGLMENSHERARLGATARVSVAKYKLDTVLDLWESMFEDVLR